MLPMGMFLARAAVGNSWLTTGVLGGAAWLLNRTKPRQNPGKWLEAAQCLWRGWILGEAMGQLWKGELWICGILLALSVWVTTCQDKEKQAAEILGTVAAVLAAVPLLAGIRGISLKNLKPEWQLESAMFVSLILMQKQENAGKGAVAATLWSAALAGVLGKNLGNLSAPLEAFATATAKLSGFLVLATYLGGAAGSVELLAVGTKQENSVPRTLTVLGAIAGIAWGMEIPPVLEVSGSIGLLWGIPWICAVKRKSKKREKSA